MKSTIKEMLPAEVYRPRTYPPPGRQWPQWGDRQLDTAFASLSEEAHANLAGKREEMRDIHKERLEKQGLVTYKRPGAAEAARLPTPPPSAPPSPPIPPASQYYNMDADTEMQTEQASSEQGAQTERKKLAYQRGVAVNDAPVKKQLVYISGMWCHIWPLSVNNWYINEA